MISSVVKILRPKQWTKNLIIFSGLIFSVNLFHRALIIKNLLAFILFCGLSSSIYIISLLLYSLSLKHVVILDVLIISMGFVLRAVAGAMVIEVRVSPWFLICTFLLSLFLALGKRRHELVLLNDQAGEHRKILDEYSPYFLDQMISVVTPSTLLAYSIYTLSPDAICPNLEFTIPFVVYGIFRYLYLIHQRGEGGNPEIILLTDVPIIINLFLWGLSCIYIIYFFN